MLIASLPGADPAWAASPPNPGTVSIQRQQAQSRLAATQARLDSDRAQIDGIDHRLAASQAAAAAERLRLQGVAREIYEQPASPLVVLARSGSLTEALRGLIDLNQLGIAARTDRRALASMDEDAARLREDRKVLVADQDALQRSLQLELIQVSSLEVWDQSLMWQLANRDYKAPDNPAHSTPNRLVAPLAAAVLTQGFGPTSAWMEPSFGPYAHFHAGIDLAAPYGTPVVAADDGIVLTVGHDGYGYGNYVVIGHSGALTSLYGHLASISVRPGDQVKQSDKIGLEGSTGNSTGAHLHFELRLDGTPIDPRPMM